MQVIEDTICGEALDEGACNKELYDKDISDMDPTRAKKRVKSLRTCSAALTRTIHYQNWILEKVPGGLSYTTAADITIFQQYAQKVETK